MRGPGVDKVVIVGHVCTLCAKNGASIVDPADHYMLCGG